MQGDVATETTVTNIGYRLVYLPLYVFEYEYQGERFVFGVNGQSGQSHGQRPYGAGSAKSTTWRALTGNLFGSDAAVRLIGGAELHALDRIDAASSGTYEAGGFYLMLPSSDQFLLLSKSIGWLVIGNAGEQSLFVVAQRRMRPLEENVQNGKAGAATINFFLWVFA